MYYTVFFVEKRKKETLNPRARRHALLLQPACLQPAALLCNMRCVPAERFNVFPSHRVYAGLAAGFMLGEGRGTVVLSSVGDGSGDGWPWWRSREERRCEGFISADGTEAGVLHSARSCIIGGDAVSN